MNDDLVWDGKHAPDDGGNDIAHTFKKPMVERGKKLREMTICLRAYSIAYNQNGEYHVLAMQDGEPLIIDTNGYTEPITKGFYYSVFAPGPNPFDVISWFWASRQGLDDTKNEWSYFRQSEKKLNAQEWHNFCHVYSVPKKTTGFILNGEILAYKNHSDLWATEDNFYTSQCFEPYSKVTWEDGNEYRR